MAKNEVAKIQHYVPRFILRNFSAGKAEKIHAFDKSEERSFCTNSKNVAGEGRFYDFKIDEYRITLEPGLAKIEDKAAPLIEKLLDADNLSILSPEDRALLCVFFSLQFGRTRAFKEQFRDLQIKLNQNLRDWSKGKFDPAVIEEHIQDWDENDTKMQFASFVAECPKELGIHFANKTWLLLSSNVDQPFLIGDNPLVLQNDTIRDAGLGLGVRGIEIYFPLSPIRALALWCPSLEHEFRKIDEELALMKSLAPEIARIKIRSLPKPKPHEVIASIERGSPLACELENVENLNLLQIHRSERYVFSATDSFAFVKKVIAMNPRAQTGPRMRVS